MRVLIIDDEANIRRITAAALEGMGHETADAANGDTAMQQLKATHFDAALLDLKLENENGMELLPRLLATEPGLGVIVCTGHATRENAAAARAAGAVDFIAKPFTPGQIRDALDKVSAGTNTPSDPGQ
jgi:NtrC-family two-component system response regulator AlgB